MPARLPVTLTWYFEKTGLETVIDCLSRIKVFKSDPCSFIPVGKKGIIAHIIFIAFIHCAGE